MPEPRIPLAREKRCGRRPHAAAVRCAASEVGYLLGMAGDETRFTRQQLLTLVATVACSAVVFLDSSLANVALPAIQRDLGMTTAQQQWTATSYLLALCALLLVGGRLGDIYGRKRLFMSGLAGYIVFATAAALAPSAPFLIASRALQGVAGALLVPTSLAIVNATFPRTIRGRAIGVWAAWTGVVTLLGPIAGGLLIDRIAWRAAFAITPAVAVFAILAGTRLAESRDEEAARKPPDVLGALLAVLAVGGPMLALIQGGVSGWTSLPVLAGVGVSLVAGPCFLVWESRASSAMVPLRLFRNRDLTAANVATLFVYAALYGSFFYVSLYVQATLGQTATVTGALFVPSSVLLFLLSPYAGRLNDRYGPRWLMTIGPLIVAAGFALIGFTGPGQLLTVLEPGVVLMGIGMGFTVAPLTATAIGSVEERYSGVASGLNNAVSRAAALLAIAALGAVVVAMWRQGLYVESARFGLDAAGDAALATLRDTALVVPREGASRIAEAAALEAARRAFRDGMLIAAALATGGGIVSGIWIRAGSTAETRR